jgi:kumamolisin
VAGYSSGSGRPAYRAPVNSGPYRNVPDVAADAASWRIYTSGQWAQVGGEAFGAPECAAFTADYDTAAAAPGKPALGYADPFLDTVGESADYGSAFHDVTTGGNGVENAGPGYDLVTGWGSYHGGRFITPRSSAPAGRLA